MYTHPMKDQITIKELKSISKDRQTDINHLIYQLDPAVPTTKISDTKKVLTDPNSHIFIALNSNQKIIGMIAISHYQQIIGIKKALIEDFVVDKEHRNKGVGNNLLKYATQTAKKLNCAHIELTSNPKRIKANSFYINQGFILRETNCYRKKI